MVKCRRPEWAPWSSTGLYSYRKNPSVWTQCLGNYLFLFHFIPLFQWPGFPLELVETARYPNIKHSKTLKTSRTFSAINFLTFSLQPWSIHPKHRLRSNFSQLSMGKALERGAEVARSVAFVSVRNKPLVGVTKFKVVKPQLISWGLWWFCFLAWTRSQVARGLWTWYVGGAVWYTTGLWKRVL